MTLQITVAPKLYVDGDELNIVGENIDDNSNPIYGTAIIQILFDNTL